MGRGGIHLYAFILTYIYKTVSSIQRQTVQHTPSCQHFQSQQALLAQVGILKIVLHIVNTPYTFNLITKIVTVCCSGNKQTVVTVLRSEREIIVFLRSHIFITADHEHSQMIPVEEQLLDTR